MQVGLRTMTSSIFAPVIKSCRFLLEIPPLSHIQNSRPVLSITGCARPDRNSKGVEVPRLHVDGSRTHKFTRETLTGTETGDDTTGRDALYLVFAIPGD